MWRIKASVKKVILSVLGAPSRSPLLLVMHPTLTSVNIGCWPLTVASFVDYDHPIHCRQWPTIDTEVQKMDCRASRWDWLCGCHSWSRALWWRTVASRIMKTHCYWMSSPTLPCFLTALLLRVLNWTNHWNEYLYLRLSFRGQGYLQGLGGCKMVWCPLSQANLLWSLSVVVAGFLSVLS